MQEPTIITAFYELDLASKSANSYKSKRTTKDYLRFFSFFAGLQNMIVIYTDCNIENEIINIRKSHNLEHKTKIIKKSLLSFSKKDYDCINDIFTRFNQANGRFDPTHPPHTSPKYVYLMYCKSFFVCDYIKLCGGGHFLKENPQESFIWLDFGYNFDGHQFIDKSQFHFALTPNPNLSHDKINLFSLGNIDSNHLPHILINGTSHFLAGGIIYGGASAWQKFHKRIKEALKAFISFQIIDDDQKLYLWIVRNYPSECMVWEIDDWFNALFYFVPKHLKDSIKIKKDSMLKSSKYCIKNISNDIYAPKRKDSTHSKDLMYSLKTASIWQRIRRFLRRILRRF